jgi:hypothetical protein
MKVVQENLAVTFLKKEAPQKNPTPWDFSAGLSCATEPALVQAVQGGVAFCGFLTI